MLLLSKNLGAPNVSLAKIQTYHDVSNLLNNAYSQAQEWLRQATELIESNPYGLSKSDALSALGSDVEEFERLVALLKFSLERASPGSISELNEMPKLAPPTIIIEQ